LTGCAGSWNQLLHPQLFALVDGESRRLKWLAGRRNPDFLVQRLPGARMSQYLPCCAGIEHSPLWLPLRDQAAASVAKGILTARNQFCMSAMLHTPVSHTLGQMPRLLAGLEVAAAARVGPGCAGNCTACASGMESESAPEGFDPAQNSGLLTGAAAPAPAAGGPPPEAPVLKGGFFFSPFPRFECLEAIPAGILATGEE